MTQLRVAIITYNWPPRNAIGTHRPYSWARHWADLGATVTVLTAQKQVFDAPLDLELPILPGVTVIEVPYGGTGGILGRFFLRYEPVRKLAKNLNRLLSKRISMPIDARAGWLTAAIPQAQDIARHVDVVVSTFGPAMAHQIAHHMKSTNPGLRWIADYRDLWSQSPLLDLAPQQRAVLRRLETSIVGGHADLITTVSQDMVEQLRDLTGKPVLMVPNGFDIDDDTLRQRLSRMPMTPKRPIRIVHTGMLYTSIYDLRPLLRALHELRNNDKIPEGAVSVDFYGARIDVARDLAKRSEYTEFIRIFGHVPREQALDVQQQADVLLLLGSAEPAARGVLTGKVFEYIASGTPVVSIGSQHDFELPQLLKATGTGIAFETHEVEALKRFIVNLVNAEEPPNFYQPNIQKIMQYSRARQAARFYEELTV